MEHTYFPITLEEFGAVIRVIHDAQYTAAECAPKIGWGHSTAEYAVRVCRDAGVKRVALTIVSSIAAFAGNGV